MALLSWFYCVREFGSLLLCCYSSLLLVVMSHPCHEPRERRNGIIHTLPHERNTREFPSSLEHDTQQDLFMLGYFLSKQISSNACYCLQVTHIHSLVWPFQQYCKMVISPFYRWGNQGSERGRSQDPNCLKNDFRFKPRFLTKLSPLYHD